jgi:hypothetical protein
MEDSVGMIANTEAYKSAAAYGSETMLHETEPIIFSAE